MDFEVEVGFSRAIAVDSTLRTELTFRRVPGLYIGRMDIKRVNSLREFG